MKIKMTSKRQAIFPRALCEAMCLAPGRRVEVEARILSGRRVWVLSPVREPETMEWVGSLRRYAGKKSLSMNTVRARIKEARVRESIVLR